MSTTALGAAALAQDAPTGGSASTTILEAAAHHRPHARLVVRHRRFDVRSGDVVHVRGVLFPRGRGRVVRIEGGAGGRWRLLTRARTRANGHFDARVLAPNVGALRLRVRFVGHGRLVPDRAGAGTLRIYRPTLASWYALYGSHLACGGTMGYETLGVAHKWLPCGTMVTLRYHGRQVTVPVVDRGPYVSGREWDLTGATARRLGFGGVGVVWSSR